MYLLIERRYILTNKGEEKRGATPHLFRGEVSLHDYPPRREGGDSRKSRCEEGGKKGGRKIRPASSKKEKQGTREKKEGRGALL